MRGKGLREARRAAVACLGAMAAAGRSDGAGSSGVRGTLLLTCLIATTLLAACGRGAPAPPARPTQAVTTVVATPRDIPLTFEFLAQTQSSQSVNIQARVSGFLDRRVYTEGDVVRAGQVLFRMDPKPFQAQVDAAQAQLNNAQAALDVARFNLDRVKPLAEQNALSAKDLDDANGNYLSAKANVDAARANLETAKLNLSYTTITSPITGISGSAVVADGTFVSTSNSQLTTVAALSPMWVTFSLSEAEMLRYREEIERGQMTRPPGGQYTVEIVLADGSVFPETGRITFADPSFNAQTGTFGVRVSVANPQGLLRPNQFVRVRLKGATRPHAQAVPLRAVQQGPKGPFVWLVGKDSTAEMRPVTVGAWVGEEWLVTGGLDPASVVVVDGALTLTPGVKVNPTPLAVPVAAAAPSGTAKAGSTDPAAGAQRPSPSAAPATNALPARIYFSSGSATLDANAREALRSIGNGLAGTPYVVDITGYVDGSGSAAKNRALAEQRAKAVRDALMATGVPNDRLRLAPPAAIVGHADPAQARRVDIALAPR
jgi:membrane fusion protein (multidrug efflux system)